MWTSTFIWMQQSSSKKSCHITFDSLFSWNVLNLKTSSEFIQIRHDKTTASLCQLLMFTDGLLQMPLLLRSNLLKSFDWVVNQKPTWRHHTTSLQLQLSLPIGTASTRRTCMSITHQDTSSIGLRMFQTFATRFHARMARTMCQWASARNFRCIAKKYMHHAPEWPEPKHFRRRWNPHESTSIHDWQKTYYDKYMYTNTILYYTVYYTGYIWILYTESHYRL